MSFKLLFMCVSSPLRVLKSFGAQALHPPNPPPTCGWAAPQGLSLPHFSAPPPGCGSAGRQSPWREPGSQGAPPQLRPICTTCHTAVGPTAPPRTFYGGSEKPLHPIRAWPYCLKSSGLSLHLHTPQSSGATPQHEKVRGMGRAAAPHQPV